MKLKIAIIGNKKNPFIYNLYKYLEKKNINISKIFLENENFSKKDFNIFKSRIDSSYKFNFVEKDAKLKKKLVYINDINDFKTSKIIKKNNVDWLIQMGVNKLFKKKILSAPTKGIINAHPGLLPFFRGCCPVEWAILLNHNIFVTVYIMDSKIDKGKIILKKKLIKKNKLTYKKLRTEVLKLTFLSIYEGIIKFKKLNFNLRKLKKIDVKEGFYFKPINDHLLKLVKNKLKNNYLS